MDVWLTNVPVNLLSVEFAQDGNGDDAERHYGYLVASANQRWEQHGMRGWTEHITVDLLPTVLIS